MSVVQYYLLHRFPVHYGTTIATYPSSTLHHLLGFYGLSFLALSSATYVIAVAFIAATTAQNRVRKFIDWLGRASIIIFTLAAMIFISAISLGTFVLYIRIQPQCCFRSSFTEKN